MTFSAKPRKRFGQHWLRDETILTAIVEAAELAPGDRVLEIGPGTGVLTQRLLAQGHPVVAVEIDSDLYSQLEQRYRSTETLVLIQGDFLRLDLHQLLAQETALPFPNKVVANIPYYITGPILEKLLGTLAAPHPDPYESIVLLVQQEIAHRLAATPGSKIFGGLSVKVQYLATCEVICPVAPQAFVPPPKVTSAVVRLRPRPFYPQASNPQFLQSVVQAGFSSKRKMLRNTLTGLIERDRVCAFLQELGLSDKVRAEDLSVAHWVTLSNKIQEEGSTICESFGNS